MLGPSSSRSSWNEWPPSTHACSCSSYLQKTIRVGKRWSKMKIIYEYDLSSLSRNSRHQKCWWQPTKVSLELLRLVLTKSYQVTLGMTVEEVVELLVDLLLLTVLPQQTPQHTAGVASTGPWWACGPRGFPCAFQCPCGDPCAWHPNSCARGSENALSQPVKGAEQTERAWLQISLWCKKPEENLQAHQGCQDSSSLVEPLFNPVERMRSHDLPMTFQHQSGLADNQTILDQLPFRKLLQVMCFDGGATSQSQPDISVHFGRKAQVHFRHQKQWTLATDSEEDRLKKTATVKLDLIKQI